MIRPVVAPLVEPRDPMRPPLDHPRPLPRVPRPARQLGVRMACELVAAMDAAAAASDPPLTRVAWMERTIAATLGVPGYEMPTADRGAGCNRTEPDPVPAYGERAWTRTG